MSETPLFAGIEAGGTKFVLAIGRAGGEVIEHARIETEAPQPTIAACLAFFDAAVARHGPVGGVGIGSFGPAGVHRDSADWGHILPTPKPGWSGTDLVTPFTYRLRCPAAFDTDVNAAMLAEHRLGAARGCASAAYVTVGTGIGGGAMLDGRLVHGWRHPEMGHLRVARHTDDHAFAGICPFHGDCLEGLASGPAIAARWGASLSEMPADHAAHEIIAWYLAQLAIALQALFSCERLVMGGGVLATPGLLTRIREQADALNASYFGTPGEGAPWIVAPGLGDAAGLRGALLMAEDAARR
ncbi:ROK family protein [Sphingomonas baiyangensis]|uniref:fructokinase n=1 Tax=Sphingomonas baiyangensis TaxID=2572576 RepID=A0A4U1KZX9_9SPHN|nr:ROK family protein [Sphingomonas baiyangensis]TKD50001.1 ROK family protein [Sphingomonas baiyangensis]